MNPFSLPQIFSSGSDYLKNLMKTKTSTPAIYPTTTTTPTNKYASMFDAEMTAYLQNKNKTPVTPAAPASTSPTSSVKTPAAQNYISSVATPASTSGFTQPQTPAYTPPPAPSPVNDAMKAYLDQYKLNQKILNDSMKPNAEISESAKRLADLNNLIASTKFEGNEDVTNKLDASGKLLSGARSEANLSARRTNEELARLGIRQSAEATTLQALQGNAQAQIEYAKQLIEAGKAVQIGDSLINPETGDVIYSKPKEGFDLSEGQARYEYDPATGQYKQIANVPKTYAPKDGGTMGGSVIPGDPTSLSPLAQAVLRGTIDLSGLTKTQAGQVAAELSAYGVQSTRQQSLATNLQAVDALLENPNIGKISGFIQGKLRLGNITPSAQLALNQFEQIKGILALDNREKLKGSGAISDFEFRVLTDAATALGRNLSDSDFKAQLQKVRDVFAGKYAQTENPYINPATQPQTGGDEYSRYLQAINQQ